MKNKFIQLKKGKERALLDRHHWVFSGAIEKGSDSLEPGDLVKVFSFQKDLLGHGYYNPKTSIAVRMLNFSDEDPLLSIKENIHKALFLREKMIFPHQETNAYRWVHAEADYLPGLIVDRYDDTLVLQISTLGMERLKKNLLEIFSSFDFVKTIFEKSLSPSRVLEGLNPCEELWQGNLKDEIVIKEAKASFLVSIREGQKTGFFFDQREMRKFVESIAKDKTILNAFGYTGGFSVFALLGNAKRVDTLDSSKKALELAKKNSALNGFSEEKHHVIDADYFDWIENQSLEEYDLVILDPPAFAKKKNDLFKARKLYEVLNEKTLEKMKKNSFLLTCSCSHFLNRELFFKTLAQAASQAGRSIKLLSSHHQSFDHPINVHHPETEYLKSLFFHVS